MAKQVTKRDGKVENFAFEKVHHAVSEAFKSCNQEVPEKFLDQLNEEFTKVLSKSEDVPLSIEEIQDIVQNFLMKKNKFEVAESYILYRDKRNRIRDQKSKLMKGIREKLEAANVQNQNANVDEKSFGGRMGEATRVITKEYALWNCMTAKSRNNHLNNEIYIHDLDSYAAGMHNCLSIPFDDLLKNGFNTRQTDVRSANSINTAMQLVAVIFQLQSLQQFGGVSATHLDWTMVPYVRKSFYKHYKDGVKYIDERVLDDSFHDGLSIEDNSYKAYSEKAYNYAMGMTEKECHQAVEGMYHNLNTLQSRSGCQLPFTSINYGTCTLPEGRMVIKHLLEVSIEGLGKFGRTSIFPCGIFQCMKGVNREPESPNYDMYKLALESTSKRLYPNYANVDWTGNAGYDRNDPRTYFSTMGCRTANGMDINGFGQLKDGRGNICPVTVILPTIAMKAKIQTEKQYPEGYTKEQIFENFISLLDTKIGEAKDMLIERFNWICKQSPDSAKFMYENHTMAGYVPEEGIVSALKHGTLALGQIGLAETLQLLFGYDHTTEKGMNYAKQIEGLYKKRCAEFKEKYKLNIGVYYTPAESLCKTALRNFRKKYGVIPHVSDREYFTNSIHVPVWHDVDPFEKIDIESQLTGYSNAGCITYVELPASTIHNIDALDTLVNYAMDKDVPYFAINVPVDTCEDCGYQAEINDVCPKCGSDHITRLRRVTGYLTGDYKTAFNEGKIAETEERVKHVKN